MTAEASRAIPLPRGADKEQPRKPAPKRTEEKAAQKAARAAGEVKPAYPDCAPKPVSVDEVRKSAGADSHTWGFTNPVLSSGVQQVVFENGICKFKVTSLPSIAFDPFVYTRANKKGEHYLDGTDISLDQPCVGAPFEKHVQITPEMSEVIRDAEIEHCNDNHRAFDLTYGRYITLIKALSGGFMGMDVSNCNDVVAHVFKDIAGFEPGDLVDKMTCLSRKSQLRDKPDWHQFSLGTPKYAKDCKSATYTPDYTTTNPEVGKHSSAEIIKGCGVKA